MQGLSVETIQAAQTGDHAAQSQLAERLYGYFLRVLRLEFPPEDARDLAQEAVIRVCRSLHQYDPGRPLLPWAMRVLKSARAEWAEQSRRQLWTQAVGEQGNGPALSTPAEHLEELPDGSPTPQEVVHATLQRDLLLSLIQQLPSQERYVLNLRCFRGLTFREISALMGVSPQKVHRVCASARKRLLSLCKDITGEEP